MIHFSSLALSNEWHDAFSTDLTCPANNKLAALTAALFLVDVNTCIYEPAS